MPVSPMYLAKDEKTMLEDFCYTVTHGDLLQYSFIHFNDHTKSLMPRLCTALDKTGYYSGSLLTNCQNYLKLYLTIEDQVSELQWRYNIQEKD